MIVILCVKFSPLRSIIDGVKGNVLVLYGRKVFVAQLIDPYQNWFYQ